MHKSYQVGLCGHVYSSYRQAAKIYGMDKKTLIRHVKKYGKDDPRIFTARRYNTPIYLGRTRYENLKQAAKSLNLTKDGLYRRIEKYGLDSPKTSKIKHDYRGLMIDGVQYESIAQAARAHHMNPSTLRRRINRGIPLTKEIFSRKRIVDKKQK